MTSVSYRVSLKRIAFVLLLLLLAVAVTTFLINLKIVRDGGANIAQSPEEIPSAQVAIVLGARVFDGGILSDVLTDRLETGIDLYKAGKVKKLLLTGDHGQTGYDEVNTMRKYALAKGIPPQDVFMDHAGFNTYDSMYRARDVFNVKKAIVVTQKFHLTRSVYIANALGIDAVGFAADRHVYIKAAQFDAREVLARVKAFIQLHITHPKPRFLGPKIPITGDGRRTWDEI